MSYRILTAAGLTKDRFVTAERGRRVFDATPGALGIVQELRRCVPAAPDTVHDLPEVSP